MIMSLDPVAFYLAGWPVRWYALSYLLPVLYAYRASCVTPDFLNRTQWHEAVDRIVLCGLVGGRLGHGLMYDGAWWWQHPWEALFIWHGGMSFFGGVIGGMLGVLWTARRLGVSYWGLSDRVVSCLPLGLALGRCANLVNAECMGRVMSEARWWSVVFPSVDGLPRYPTQVIEAFGEGVCLGLLLTSLPLGRRGLRTASFLLGYGLLRLLIEPFKEPEALWCVYRCANPSIVLAALTVMMGLWVACYCRVVRRGSPH